MKKVITQFVRNFNRQKVVGLLGIGSLALGVMVSVVIGLWTINEMSFDNFHHGSERMYRIITKAKINGVENSGALSRPQTGDLAKARLPEVEDKTAIQFRDGALIRVDGIAWDDVRPIVAEPNFFTFFNFPLVEGNAATVLDAPDKVVVSESAALKYFGGEDVMGRTVIFSGRTYSVSGIMRDAPSNSHLQPEMVFHDVRDWGDGDIFSTYLRLREGTDVKSITESVQGYMYEVDPYMKNMDAVLKLEPLREIHFTKNSIYDPAVKGDMKIVSTFMLVAIIILVISCMNFMNLFVSTSFLRAKTIGVKKTMGANRFSLMSDFYGETAVYVLISLVAGIFLATACMPVFNSIVHTNISIDFSSPRIYLFAAVLALAVIVMAGSFPALYMTRFGIMETLREKFKGKNMSFLQKAFLVMQFAAATFLLIVVAFFGRQVDHMLAVDLGFDKENIIWVKGTNQFGGNNDDAGLAAYESLREEFLLDPSIADITMRRSLPTQWSGGSTLRKNPDAPDVLVEIVGVMPNYFDFMGMQIVEGENPFIDAPESEHIVLNQSAAKVLDLANPVDEMLIRGSGTAFQTDLTVSGIVKNAQLRSLRAEIEPQVYVNVQRGSGGSPHLFFKYTGDPQRVISLIEEKWNSRVTDGVPFEYHFLDRTYAELYRSETDSRNVLGFALIITLIITIAGLFAMAYFSMQRRIKEVGIRKINGATLSDLMLLLNRNMFTLVSVSFVIGALASLVFLNDWLTGFVERTPLSMWIFLGAGVLIFAVALMTVSYQTWKTATANPVKALKNE